MAVRAELYCYFCGHGLGEVVVPTNARRPSLDELREAYAVKRAAAGPVWDESSQPLCPRCGGQLFLERFEHEVVWTRERQSLRRAS